MDEKSPLKQVQERLKAFFFGRKVAYHHVFNIESQAVQTVLKDLSQFCRANANSFHQDPRVHALLEGRREVWLRIMDHLNLDPEEFWKKYGRGNNYE